MKSFSLAVVLAAGLALAGCHWGLYSATAEIEVRPRGNIDQAWPSLNDGPTDPKEIAVELAHEVEIMQSADLLMPVIRRLDLSSVWAKRYKSDRSAMTDEEAVAHLNRVLKIEVVPDTRIIKISASSEVPQEAADIANALADSYKALRDGEEERRNERGLETLRDYIAQQQTVLDDKRAVLERQRQIMSKGVLVTSGPSHEDDSSALLAFRAAIRDCDQQQNLVYALNLRLKQVVADLAKEESPVRILQRAEPPPE